VLYGLLGAELTPAETAELQVEVGVTRRGGRRIEWALAARIDDVRVGLPREFAEPVLTGATESGNARELGPSLLQYDCAAYTAVGSAPIIFQRIAALVVQLLLIGDAGVTQEQLESLIGQALGLGFFHLALVDLR
jgi:hypothetical protein